MKEPIHGVLPDYQINQLITDGILNGANIERIQPASIDIELDLNTLISLDYFTLPIRGESIESLVMNMRKSGTAKDAKSFTLNTKKHYLVRMKESFLNVPCFTRANPKSSAGRIFTHSRLLCDKSSMFDEVPVGHTGSLWTLITPKFFPVTLHETEQLNQLRFFYGDARLSVHELCRELHFNPDLVQMPAEDERFDEIEVIGSSIGEIPISVDLKGKCYRTRKTSRPLGLQERDAPLDAYYELIDPESIKNGLILEEGYGYLIGTVEQFQVGNNMAFEVIASDKHGEIQIDFAGFGDPGFGLRTIRIGNSVTLEIVSYEKGLCIRHGQYVGTVRFEYMAGRPQKMYQGNYVHQERGAKAPKYVK
jgi:deoxycytidine triphosphate deaminase